MRQFTPLGIRMGFSCFAKAACSLGNRIEAIFPFSARPKMRRIAASLVGYTGMEDEKAVRNVLFVMRNPSDSVTASDDSLLQKPKTKRPVSVFGFEACRPRPAFVWTFYLDLAPKSFLEFFREYLRKQFRWNSLRLHKSVQLIFATLSATLMARGHFYYAHQLAGAQHNLQ